MVDTALLDNPKLDKSLARTNDIVNRIAAGENQTLIAKDHKLSEQRISQIKKQNEAIVEAKKQELIAKLPTVVDTVTEDIDTNKELSTELKHNLHKLDINQKLQLKNQLDKTNANVLKSVGIYQSQSALVNIQNIHNEQTNTLIVPEYQEYLAMKAQNRQVIDINNGDETT